MKKLKTKQRVLKEMPESGIAVIYSGKGLHVVTEGLEEIRNIKATKDGETVLIDVSVKVPEGHTFCPDNVLPGDKAVGAFYSAEGLRLVCEGLEEVSGMQISSGGCIFINASVKLKK